MREIVAITRLYVGPSLDFDVQVVLRKVDVPQSQLGRAGDPTGSGGTAGRARNRPQRIAVMMR